MIDLIEIYSNLSSNNNTTENLFSVEPIPNSLNHKIGITKDGRPLFFVRCMPENEVNVLDNNLELISVKFNRKCQLRLTSSKNISDYFTIIELLSETSDLQEYFIQVIYILIKEIGDYPTFIQLKNEVDKIVNLFSKFKKVGSKSIQGIWAELFIIASSVNPEYLINAWHVSPSDKFDFNDGVDKIEVKSTSKCYRKHFFSLEQLNPNSSSHLLIASLYAVQSGVGKSIMDLVELINKKNISIESSKKIHLIVGETLGSDICKISQTYFDFNLALDSLKFYESECIPKIDAASIPNEITNVKFECDISYCQSLRTVNTNSKLHQALSL